VLVTCGNKNDCLKPHHILGQSCHQHPYSLWVVGMINGFNMSVASGYTTGK